MQLYVLVYYTVHTYSVHNLIILVRVHTIFGECLFTENITQNALYNKMQKYH